ncbi:uncharacterized protein LOC117761228 [Hippoglossus hippoglossus]|uniref:uncharacterized protein LOC117761228 n=1 Tax=Hippoglossus hippoglossus TaxID=8267 RepID=UPI00148E6586|nr:uncharacterized protein LOC117761228 [Hippoglossus hippoglossus]
MWAYRLTCPNCGNQLTGAGLYKTVRRVLDIDGWYFMGTEYLECGSCKRKYSAWAQDIIRQLDLAHQEKFPAVLTLSCDKRVVGLMKERTLGNSASRLRAILVEQHTKEWMVRSLSYLSVLSKLQVPGVAPRQVSVPPMNPIPTVPWLISIYAREALGRLEEMKARVTSIFGDILKLGSTKKMTKKLAGNAAGMAERVTNVSNEHRQVLMSVLTASEEDGLLPMAAGLVRRYREAGRAPPRVLYVNRDCCATAGRCKVAALFGEWDQLLVRLDVWHLMQRFARAVTADSHQQYGLFMSRLSFAMLEWDGCDVARLKEAKQSKEGREPTSRELARHCRRYTRGVAETELLIQEVLDSFSEVTDTMGVLLFERVKMEEVWSTQRHHLRCIQDPPGVELYAKKGEVTRGGVKLPVYRCARGTSSLEWFHHHLCTFVPGTSANALHFQVYLLEGLVRWNEDCARVAVESDARRSTLRCYSAQLQRGLSQLTQQFLGMTLVENYTQPGEYTGELIGLEYLYSQTGAAALQLDVGRDHDALDGTDGLEEDWEEVEYEGFEEELHRVSPVAQLPHPVQTAVPTQPYHPPAVEEEEEVRGPDGHRGYQHAVHLAHALVELRHHAFVTQRQVREIVSLWQKLSDRDKAPISFPQRRCSKTAHTPGVDSVTSSYLGQGAGAAQFPYANRMLEAIFLELSHIHHEGCTIAGVPMNRWGAVERAYSVIRDNLYNRRDLLAAAPIQLPEVNNRTLLQW